MGLVSIVRWRRIVHLVTAPLVWPLIAFAGLAIVSTLWSAVPGYTFAAAMGLMFTALFACLIAAELPRPLVFRILVGCTMFNFGSAAAAALILPDVAWVPPDAESTGYRLQGLSSHPNILAKEVAALCCLTAPFLVAAGRRYATMVLVGVALLIIAASGSRTSLLAMVFALAAPLAKRPGAIRFAALAAAIVVTPLLLLGSIGAAPDFGALVAGASRSGDSSELLTLTGRTELWGFIWQKIQDAPLLGYGFDAAEAVLSKDWWGQVDAGVEAHNMLLQSLLTLGVFGAVWLVTWFAQLFRRWLSDANSALLFFAPYLLVLSFTEAEICTHPDLVGFAGLLAVALDSTHACGAQK
jgi:O-antigen ligase